MTIIADFDGLSGEVPWGQLQHAGGPADDTPDHLGAVWAGGRTAPEGVTAGYGHLWSDLIGGGRVWTSTAPAAYLLAMLIQDERFGDPDPTLRQGVLIFFREIVTIIDAGPPDWVIVPSILDLVGPAPVAACRLVLPVLFRTELSMLAHEDVRTASCAATAATSIAARGTVPAADRATIVQWLDARARSELPITDRASALLDLGELRHAAPDFLADQQPAMRLAAALAPELADDDRATDALLELATSPESLDVALSPPGDPGWSTLPQFRGKRLPAVVAEAVCARVRETDRLTPGAMASLSIAASPGGQTIIRPYLSRIFPDGMPHGDAVTRGQRLLAKAMLESRRFWEWGGRDRLFRSLRLPSSEDSWRAVVES